MNATSKTLMAEISAAKRRHPGVSESGMSYQMIEWLKEPKPKTIAEVNEQVQRRTEFYATADLPPFQFDLDILLQFMDLTEAGQEAFRHIHALLKEGRLKTADEKIAAYERLYIAWDYPADKAKAMAIGYVAEMHGRRERMA